MSERCIGDVASVRGPMINGCVLYGATKFGVTTVVHRTHNYLFKPARIRLQLFHKRKCHLVSPNYADIIAIYVVSVVIFDIFRAKSGSTMYF